MTLRFRCCGRCQDRVERTGKWEKVGDVVPPRLSAMLVVRSSCHMFVFDLCWDIKNTLAWSAAERTGCNVVKQSFQYHGSLNR